MGKRTAALITMLPVAVGACSGFAIVATVPYRDEPLWQVWAVLGVGLTTAAGFVFVHGLWRWRDMFQESLRLHDVAFPVACLAAVAVVSTVFSVLQEGPSAWRGPLLVSLAIFGTMPSACTMYGIRQAALDHLPGAKTIGERTATLVRLGRVLRRRLLPAVGSLVALATLALAVAARLHESRVFEAASRNGRPMTPEVILVFGGMGSLLVALLYVPAAGAIRQEGEALCDLLFDLHTEDDGARVSELLEKRHRFEQILGTDRDFLADLQIGVVVLGPIISSAVSGLLPG
jgi:hypothetical protein